MSARSTGDKASTRLGRYLDSVRYARHVIFRPFDGFWDLVHENRGTMGAAHTFLFLFLAILSFFTLFTNIIHI